MEPAAHDSSETRSNPPGFPGEEGTRETVKVTHACRRCGYDLFGLPVAGVCPECGASVERSLRGNLLELADPDYLKLLRLGTALVEAAVICICAIPLLFGVAAFVMVMLPRFEGVMGLLPPVATLLCLSAAVLVVAGWLILTTPDPAQVGLDTANRSRLITRIATIVSSVSWVAGAAVSALWSATLMTPGTMAVVSRLGGLVLLVAVWVQVIVSMRYLGHLAERIPDRQLVGKLVAARQLAVVSAGLCGFTALLALTRFTLCLAFVSGLMAVIFSLVLLVRYADLVDQTRQRLSELVRTANLRIAAEVGEYGRP